MEHRHIVSGTSVEAVRELLIQRQFLEAFSDEVGVTLGDIDMSDTGNPACATMPWEFHTDIDGIPSLARKFLPRSVHVLWTQEWRDDASGLLRVDLSGKPSAVCTGDATLIQQQNDVNYTVLTTTKTSLHWPMAGKVGSMINKDLVGWILTVQVRVLRRQLGIVEPGTA